jgi:hypothetical protein
MAGTVSVHFWVLHAGAAWSLTRVVSASGYVGWLLELMISFNGNWVVGVSILFLGELSGPEVRGLLSGLVSMWVWDCFLGRLTISP